MDIFPSKNGYNSDLKIAFEYNGPQHYEIEHYMEAYDESEADAIERFKAQNIRDLIKIHKCLDQGVTLIVISYYDDHSSWVEIIKKQYEISTGEKAPDLPPLDYNRVLSLISKKRLESIPP